MRVPFRGHGDRLPVSQRCRVCGECRARTATGAAHLQQDELPAQSPATKLKNLQDLHPQGNAGNQPIFVATPTVNKLPVNISDADLLALIKSSISGAAFPFTMAFVQDPSGAVVPGTKIPVEKM